MFLKLFFLFFMCDLLGKETVHELFGTRVAVLAGDFMFAQASWYLANLENLEVIKLISQVSRRFFPLFLRLEEGRQYNNTISLNLGLSPKVVSLTGKYHDHCVRDLWFEISRTKLILHIVV